jgi:hypothetical protein
MASPTTRTLALFVSSLNIDASVTFSGTGVLAANNPVFVSSVQTNGVGALAATYNYGAYVFASVTVNGLSAFTVLSYEYESARPAFAASYWQLSVFSSLHIQPVTYSASHIQFTEYADSYIQQTEYTASYVQVTAYSDSLARRS